MPAVLTLLALAAVAGIVAFVLMPLRGQEQPQPRPQAQEPQTGPVAALLEEREAALTGLAELDFDRNLGNLSEEDYLNLRSQYRAQAIEILKSLDAHLPAHEARSNGGVHPSPSGPAPATPVGQPTTSALPASRQAAGSQNAGALNRRAGFMVVGTMALALVMVALWIAWLRGPGNSTASAENAPTLSVMHSHAAFLVPGARVALVAHHNGLLRSTDDGRTWTAVQGVAGDATALASNAPAIYLAVADKVMVSRDAGLTWEQAGVPSPGARITALATGDGKSALLYAAVAGNGLYRTTDLRTWQLTGGDLATEVDSMVFQPGSLSVLYGASPGNGVLASGDGGQTWGSANGVLNAVLPTLAVRSLAFNAASGDQFIASDGTRFTGAMYAGTDMGLFKTIDAGSSWSPMPLREPISAVSARSDPAPLLLVVDSRSRVWRSTDKGNTWSANP